MLEGCKVIHGILTGSLGTKAMSETITIDLQEETKAGLDAASLEEGVSQSELIDRALKDYLFIRRFRNLRERMMAQVPETYTDQDVFDRVS